MEWLDVVKDLNAGTIGGVAGIVTGHPLDTVKVQLQTGCDAKDGVLRTLRRVVGTDGAAGLYRGLLSPILSNAPINAVVFGVQGQVVRVLERRSGRDNVDALSADQHFVAGASAGLVQVVFAAPSEHVKIQMQVGVGGARSSLDCGRQILRRYGLRTLYRGWEISVLRDVPAFGAYFCGYEAVKHALTGGRREQETDVRLMVAGGVAGMLSWVVSMPQDVVKSCVQSQKLDGPQLGMNEMARTRLAAEGPGFFFKGFSATMLRAFPVSAVTFLVYEKVMQLMS